MGNSEDFRLVGAGCLTTLLGAGLLAATVLVVLLGGLSLRSPATIAAAGFAGLPTVGVGLLLVDAWRHRAGRHPRMGADFDGRVWIVWYEDQFSHDPSFPTALCFSEAQGYQFIQDAGGKLLVPGYDGHTVDSSTAEQVRWLFQHSHPEQVAELEWRVARGDYRPIPMPL